MSMEQSVENARTRAKLEEALAKLEDNDQYLLENNLSERCIASRLALYLQAKFPTYCVDVEYNRSGNTPKRLSLPAECANYNPGNEEPLVVPDIVVHQRGADGPNVLVLELKKTTNRESRNFDLLRIQAFMTQLHYSNGALIECETRPEYGPGLIISHWF
jgi:hypothetical protein